VHSQRNIVVLVSGHVFFLSFSTCTGSGLAVCSYAVVQSCKPIVGELGDEMGWGRRRVGVLCGFVACVTSWSGARCGVTVSVSSCWTVRFTVAAARLFSSLSVLLRLVRL